MRLIVPAVDDRPAPAAVGEPSTPHHRDEPATHREPGASPSAMVAGGAADGSASQPHRSRAVALMRQLGGRTEAELRRELAHFFAARPGLSEADRAPIARAMARLRNQLLHHPRSSLRATAVGDYPAGAPALLDAAGRLFGLVDAYQTHHPEPLRYEDRPTRSSTSAVPS